PPRRACGFCLRRCRGRVWSRRLRRHRCAVRVHRAARVLAMSQEGSLFVLLAATGLLVQFGLQAAINMASSLHLIPTKGMTLPFLSYGGSSMLALGLGMGMMLALTRRRLGGSPL